MKIYSLYKGTHDAIDVKSIFFPGGEPHVELPVDQIRGGYIWLDARIGTMNDFATMLVVADAIKRCNPAQFGLFIPYFPGARQDRAIPGTALTVKIFANIVNQIGVNAVSILDPHSDVLPALLECEAIPSWKIIQSLNVKYDGLICPDVGAEKRVYAAAKELGIQRVIRGSKKRDMKTGKLSGFDIEPLGKAGQYLLVDDICDGGGTFVGLGEHLSLDPDFGMSEIDLYVSHGIFSKPLTDIKRYFQQIITTDSFPAVYPYRNDAAVHVVDLIPFALASFNGRMCK